MKFIPDLPTIRLIAGELVIGYFICLLPVLLTGTFDEQTLMVGLILASIFLIPAEFARLNKAKSKHQEFQEIERIVRTVVARLNKAKSKYQELKRTVRMVVSELKRTVRMVASAPMDSQVMACPPVVIPRQEKPLTSEVREVFIDFAPPDMQLANQLEKLLGTTFNYSSQIDFSKGPTEIRKSLEHNLKSCDAVIILYGHTSSYPWLQAQLSYCRRILVDRDQPLKVVVCNLPSPTKSPLGPLISNVRILEGSTLADCLPSIKEILTNG